MEQCRTSQETSAQVGDAADSSIQHAAIRLAGISGPSSKALEVCPGHAARRDGSLIRPAISRSSIAANDEGPGQARAFVFRSKIDAWLRGEYQHVKAAGRGWQAQVWAQPH
jgi:hypothetical protein